MSARGRWTDADLPELSWHDCRVHALALPAAPAHRLILDLDFIVEWVPAPRPAPCFRFRVAPATLAFADVTELSVAVEVAGDLTIDRIERESQPGDPRWPAWRPPARWTIHTHGGAPGRGLRFLATGFVQALRAAPRLIEEPGTMSLDLAERGGLSFALDAAEPTAVLPPAPRSRP